MGTFLWFVTAHNLVLSLFEAKIWDVLILFIFSGLQIICLFKGQSKAAEFSVIIVSVAKVIWWKSSGTSGFQKGKDEKMDEETEGSQIIFLK